MIEKASTGQEGNTNKALSAFIKDPETMAYLVERWRNYALTEGRSFHHERFWDQTYTREIFNQNPDLYHDPKMYGLDGRFTLADHQNSTFFQESAERLHGVNFFNEIRGKIEARKSKGDTTPVNILVTGSDLSFFNDELRLKFRDDVTVYGTTVELSRARMRKKRFVKSIRDGKTRLEPELQKYLTGVLSETLDPRDGKWRSILQMQSDKPEFDMIIDTCGELLYSDDENRPEIFEMTFEACIVKLNPGGKLYIAELPWKRMKFVEEYCIKNNLKLEKNQYENRHQDTQTNFIITKPL